MLHIMQILYGANKESNELLDFVNQSSKANALLQHSYQIGQ